MSLNQELRFSVAPMMDGEETTNISAVYKAACAEFEHGGSAFLPFSFVRGMSILAAGLRRGARVALRRRRANATAYPRIRGAQSWRDFAKPAAV